MSLERKLIKIAKIIVADAGTDFKIRKILFETWRNLSNDNQYLDGEYNKFYHFHHLDHEKKEYNYQRRTNENLNLLVVYCLHDAVASGTTNYTEDFIDSVYRNHKSELKQDIEKYKKDVEGLSRSEQNKEIEKTIMYIKDECEKIERDLENVAVVPEPVHMFLTSDEKIKKKNYSLDDIKELIKLLDNGTSDNEELKKDVDNFLKKRIENTKKFMDKDKDKKIIMKM